MQEKLFEIIAKIMGVPADTVTIESSPESIPSWESLRHMRLLLAVEEAFSVEFLDDEIVEINDAQSIMQKLEEKGAR